MSTAMVTPDGVRVEAIVLDRGQGPRPCFRVTDRHGYAVAGGYVATVAELARLVDLAELREVAPAA